MKDIKKVLLGVTLTSLVAGTLLTGCGGNSSCGKGSCGDKATTEVTANAEKSSCGK